MKLIFAQGNPGSEFEKTRHNVGFTLLDAFAHTLNIEFQHKPKFHADIAVYSSGDEKILLVKPTTFYNETGLAAQALLDFYKIEPQNLLVIHDDIALPFGTLRTREKGSDAGNNGIKSLNSHVGQNYPRLRVGIWNERSERMERANFVLAKFSSEEQQAITEHIGPQSAQLIEEFIQNALPITSLQSL